jgi:hypothetical protein
MTTRPAGAAPTFLFGDVCGAVTAELPAFGGPVEPFAAVRTGATRRRLAIARAGFARDPDGFAGA